MTKSKDKQPLIDVKELLQTGDTEWLRGLVENTLQEVLEDEMDACLQAGRHARVDGRVGYRSGHRERGLRTRVGQLTLRVPRDRDGLFSTALFSRYQRSERALMLTLIEMYIQGVSTRRVAAICEQLCGHAVAASTVSDLCQQLDASLTAFRQRQFGAEEEFPYLILDARYNKARVEGTVQSQAVLVAVGVDWTGHRQVLGIELAHGESKAAWGEFLRGLKERGLRGVQYVVTDDHEGLVQALHAELPLAKWQRCYVHFLRNAADKLHRKVKDDCLTELGWLYDRHDRKEAERDLAGWLQRWESRHPQLCTWVEENIQETFTFYCLPHQHRKHLKSTNMLERQNEEFKRRTQVARIFPNPASLLRLLCAMAVELHEAWITGDRYLNMDLLKEAQEQTRRTLRAAAGAGAPAPAAAGRLAAELMQT